MSSNCKQIERKEYSYIGISVSAYVVFLFCIYPLIFHDYYFDIVTFKYKAFLCAAIVLITLSVPAVFVEKKRKNRTMKLKPELSDYLFLVFLAVNIISCLLSDYGNLTVYGTKGRNAGLITIGIYVVVYLLVKNFYTLKKLHLYLFGISSVCVSIIGIMQFFMIDPIGFYQGLSNGQRDFYFSTLGHGNVYTSYFAISLPVFVFAFIKSGDRKFGMFSFVVALINCLGMFSGQCDSGYLILAAVIVEAILISKDIWEIKRCIFLFSAMIIYSKAMAMINVYLGEKRGLQTLPEIYTNNYVCMMLIALLIILYFFISKGGKRFFEKRTKGIFILGIVAVVFGYIGLMIFFSTIGKDFRLGAAEGYLRFSDAFGSFRGYIWKTVLCMWKEEGLVTKLFGIGTDVLRPYLIDKCGNEMHAITGAYYDNAHNEYLQYLITNGLLGLITYLGFVGARIKELWCGSVGDNSRNNAENIENSGTEELKMEKCNVRLCLICAIITYMISAMVNINQVVTTPLFIVVLGINCRPAPLANAKTINGLALKKKDSRIKNGGR